MKRLSALLIAMLFLVGNIYAQDHTVNLTFVPSPTPGVIGYNAGRSAVSGGPYVTLNAAPFTGTSYADSTVTDGKTYFYVITATDGTNFSPPSNEVTAVIPGTTPPPPTCTVIPVNTWTNTGFASQTGQFQVDYDAIPSSTVMDSITGLSSAAATGFTSFGPIVWFSNVSTIQARNAGVYQAAATYRYAANTTYHIRMTVNVATRTYSAWVHTGTAAETQIANNYAFRTEQASVTSLAFFGVYVNVGTPTIQVCNFALSGAAPPPVTITIAPTTKTLVEGATQLFTDTVSNTTNTAVNWTATGGTISQAGLFTAGTTPVIGSVTVTSVADSTKSASAAVTVTAPPPSLTMTCAGLVCTLKPVNEPSGSSFPVSATGPGGVTASGTAVAP